MRAGLISIKLKESHFLKIKGFILARKSKPVFILGSLLLFILLTFAFQNCGQFKTQPVESISEVASSTPPPTTPGPAPQPPVVTPPVITPPENPDYNSDVLKRIGLKLTSRGNSTCQLQPPVIPAFDQANDGPNVLKVCKESSCQYKSIAEAMAVAPAGSLIAVKAGTYDECVRITKDNITLQGRGGRPVIRGSECPRAAWHNAIIGVSGDNAKIENFEITDPTENLAIGIGLNKANGNLNVHNVFVHHAQGGVATVSPAGDITITSSYFDHTGHMEGTDPHTTAALTIGLKSRSGIIKNVTVTHPKQKGGTISVSSIKGVIDCVVVADLGGLGSQLIKNQYGFDLSVTNSVLQRDSLSIPQMLLYWDRTSDPVPYHFTGKNNIFISDQPKRDREMLVLMGDAVPTTISGNIFIGPDSVYYSKFPESKSYESRAEAGLAQDVIPYPGASLSAP